MKQISETEALARMTKLLDQYSLATQKRIIVYLYARAYENTPLGGEQKLVAKLEAVGS